MKRYIRSNNNILQNYDDYVEAYYKAMNQLQGDFPECEISDDVPIGGYWDENQFYSGLNGDGRNPMAASFYVSYRGSGDLISTKDIRDISSLSEQCRDIINRIDMEAASDIYRTDNDKYVDLFVNKHTRYDDFHDYYSSMSEYLIPGDMMIEFLETKYTGDEREIKEFCNKLINGFDHDTLEDQGLITNKLFIQTLLNAMIDDVAEYAADQGYPRNLHED